MNRGAEKTMAIYRSPDEIGNLRVRVTIREVQGDEDLEGNVLDVSETRTFSWQQKVYGKFEREFYKDKSHCISELEKSYHEEIVQLTQDDGILFTYVNEDEFGSNEENLLLNSSTTSNLCRRIKTRHLISEESKTKEFDFHNSLIAALHDPYGDQGNFEIMHIMADLGEYLGNTWLKSEHALCTIKYDRTHKLLLVVPDFTDLEPYRIQSTGDSQRSFLYHICDVSERMPTEVLLKENEILNKILAHQMKLRAQQVGGAALELPPKHKLRVYLFLEILSGRNFEYNDIYVHYFIDLPENCLCNDPTVLRGTTQTSRTSGRKSLAFFGFPFEICLEYDIHELDKTDPPYIYFEVVSKDSWDRFRTEGLTYTVLPVFRPGAYYYHLNCLRLCSRGPLGNLRRFFIGDYSNYNDITWLTLPKNFKRASVNKYGVDTISTGRLDVRVSVVQQAQALMGSSWQEATRMPGKFSLEKLSMSALVRSVEHVLEAFKAAKQKMIEARQNV